MNNFDEVEPWQWQFSKFLGGVERAESMDVQNDPRFFATNIMDKRLGAFKSLTLVSSLMFGTSMGMCFKVKKSMDFSKWEPFVGYIAYWELAGFLISFVVAAMCLISLYVISHQLFFCYRLKTSGVMGYEQATIFYLTRVIVVWRHVAMFCLFNGLWLFVLLIGIQFFISFYKDADEVVTGSHNVWFTNIVNGTSQSQNVVHMNAHNALDMRFHTVLGYAILCMFFAISLVMYFIRKHHLTVFQLNYKQAKALSDPITDIVLQMGSRQGTAVQG